MIFGNVVVFLYCCVVQQSRMSGGLANGCSYHATFDINTHNADAHVGDLATLVPAARPFNECRGGSVLMERYAESSH